MADYDDEDDDKGEGNERPTGSDVGIEREDSNGGISAGAPLSRPHSSTVPAGAAATPAASTAAAAAVAAPPPPATAAAAVEAADAIDGGGGGESPDTIVAAAPAPLPEYATAALAAQAAAGAPPSGPLRIAAAAAAVSADAAAVGVVGFSNLNPDGLGGGVPAAGSTPLAPAPHGVSIATVIQIGRAIPRTAASIIRYLWKALCFWGFSLFRYRAAISDSL
jgi:hypothetical protein